jgi:hypothetical protein
MDLVSVDLLPGERILWEGRPVRYRPLRPSDALILAFGVIWCGMALFWETSALTHRAGPPNPPPIGVALWAIPVVLVGLYLAVGRFVLRVIVLRRTRYVITDRRLVRVSSLFGTRTKTSYLKSLPPPVITERLDGSGNLAFGAFLNAWDEFARINGWRGRGDRWRAWAIEPWDPPALWDIPDVRRVRDLIANAQGRGPVGQPW